jgi:hypothetical protein
MASKSSEFGATIGDSDVAVPDFGSAVVKPLTGVAFWAAIALPFLHLPLLATTGLDSSTTAAAFAALLVLNVVALIVGHSHDRS